MSTPPSMKASTSIDQLQYVPSAYSNDNNTATAQSNNPPLLDDTITSRSALLNTDNNDTSNKSSSSLPSLSFIPFIRSISQYFDFDEWEIQQRLLRAITPFAVTPMYESSQPILGNDDLNSSNTDDSINTNRIDLYAPFWITYTCILLISAAGNLSSYLAYINTHDEDTTAEEWSYDFQIVTFTFTTLNSYLFVLSIILYLWMKRTSVPMYDGGLAQIISIIGYSLIFFIPTSLLLLIDISASRWISLALCWVLSSIFLARNLWLHHSELRSNQQMIPIIGSIIVVQAFLVLGIRLQCFSV